MIYKTSKPHSLSALQSILSFALQILQSSIDVERGYNNNNNAVAPSSLSDWTDHHPRGQCKPFNEFTKLTANSPAWSCWGPLWTETHPSGHLAFVYLQAGRLPLLTVRPLHPLADSRSFLPPLLIHIDHINFCSPLFYCGWNSAFHPEIVRVEMWSFIYNEDAIVSDTLLKRFNAIIIKGDLLFIEISSTLNTFWGRTCYVDKTWDDPFKQRCGGFLPSDSAALRAFFALTTSPVQDGGCCKYIRNECVWPAYDLPWITFVSFNLFSQLPIPISITLLVGLSHRPS